MPFFPVFGNHDVKGNVQAQLYQSRFHRFWSMPNYSYSFETGPVRFHAINTNCHLNAWYRLYQSFDEHSMDNSGKPWNVVFGHHPGLFPGKSWGYRFNPAIHLE
ncbi:MAG: metallophosphoesterase family protein [bacterium]